MDESGNDDEVKEKPVIEATQDGPYIVWNLKNFDNSKGEVIETKPVISLCRCGGSKNKPFCDGKHWHIKFKDERN